MFWFFICYQQAIHEFWGSTQFTIACCCAIVLSLEYYCWHIMHNVENPLAGWQQSVTPQKQWSQPVKLGCLSGLCYHPELYLLQLTCTPMTPQRNKGQNYARKN